MWRVLFCFVFVLDSCECYVFALEVDEVDARGRGTIQM